jgi:hypothetical protein
VFAANDELRSCRCKLRLVAGVKITLSSGQQFTKATGDDDALKTIREIALATHAEWIEVDDGAQVKREAIIALEPA